MACSCCWTVAWNWLPLASLTRVSSSKSCCRLRRSSSWLWSSALSMFVASFCFIRTSWILSSTFARRSATALVAWAGSGAGAARCAEALFRTSASRSAKRSLKRRMSAASRCSAPASTQPAARPEPMGLAGRFLRRPASSMPSSPESASNWDSTSNSRARTTPSSCATASAFAAASAAAARASCASPSIAAMDGGPDAVSPARRRESEPKLPPT
mmetsp:Transcript_54415/g.158079  ORF Transcript_54415/g.158079 Transcript_54415/m.158079 type:complete len:214 (+) Transcript_54415:1152-1793(+)